MSYGLTSAGFVLKPLDIIVEELEANTRTEVGMVPTGGLKKILGVVGGAVSEVWELAEVVNTVMDPDAATEEQLDALEGLRGSTRRAASASAVDLTLTGTPATLVSAGSRASAVTTEAEFETLDDATIALLASWASGTAYALGDRVTNGGNAYECITAGTSAGSGGPTTTAADITDNTVHWRHMGAGTGAVDVAAEATETGPLVAESGDITEIETPVSGWNGVINLLDADLGSDIEVDGDFRVRAELELAGGGDGTPDAIRAFLLDPTTGPTGITTATVFHNITDATDVDGVPPHSVETLVQGGDDQDIFDALREHVGAGIRTHGTETGISVDEEGNDQTIKFSRPTPVPIYVDVTLTYNAKLYPADGDDLVKAAIVAYGDAQPTGADAVASRISALGVFAVPGILDVVSCFIGTAPAPGTEVTVPISLRELATYDTSRISITSTPGTP